WPKSVVNKRKEKSEQALLSFEKWVTGELVPISCSLQARGRVQPGQVTSPSQGNTETYRTNNTVIHT
ncbi:hypothetical protein AMECASPLE_037941, partial [Ameca splendens]